MWGEAKYIGIPFIIAIFIVVVVLFFTTWGNAFSSEKTKNIVVLDTYSTRYGCFGYHEVKVEVNGSRTMYNVPSSKVFAYLDENKEYTVKVRSGRILEILDKK